MSSNKHQVLEQDKKSETNYRLAWQNDSSPVISNSCVSDSSVGSRVDSFVKLTNDAWVQCEKTNCLKWRRIPLVVARSLSQDEPWFCFMNAQQQYSSCDDPEEDFTQYEKAAKKCKLTYVSSVLSEGALVWAKLPGYVRWPGVVCQDPAEGCHVVLNSAGHATSYHVEFLGAKHSHSWLNHKQVEVYGTKVDNTDKSASSPSRATKCTRKRTRGRRHRGQPKPKRHHGSHGNTIEKAIAEANRLITASPTSRLNCCEFKYTDQDGFPVKDEKTVKQAPCQAKTVTAARTNTSPPEKTKSALPMSLGKKNRVVKSTTSKRRSFNEKISTSGKSTEATTTVGCRGGRMQKFYQQYSQKTDPDQLNHSLEMCKTKEEKFLIDLQIFAQNEKEFEHNLRSFHSRHNTSLAKPPCWKEVPVTYFQLFQAVYERGGYATVSKKRMWSSVLRELILSDSRYICGHAVKRYYLRNLYPYELFLMKTPCEQLIRQTLSPQDKVCTTEEARTRLQEVPRCLSDEPTRKRKCSSQKRTGISVCGSDMSGDLREIFQEIEVTGNEITYGLLQENIKQDSQRLGVNVKFYDKLADSPLHSPTQASQLSIQPCLPEESAQIVPDVMDVTSPHTSPSSSQMSSPSSDQQRVLHEMQAMQQELDQMQRHNQIDTPPKIQFQDTGNF